MTAIPASAFTRFRGVVETYRAAIGTHNDVSQRLGEGRRQLAWLKSERERVLAGTYRQGIAGRLIQIVASDEAIEKINTDIAATEKTIARLSEEAARAEARVNETGYFVLHSPSAMVIGQAGDLRTMADRLDQLEGTMIQCYRRRTGQAEATVKQWLADETWFDAKQAVEARLADAIDDAPAARAVASLDLSRFRNVPAALSAPADAWAPIIARVPGEGWAMTDLLLTETAHLPGVGLGIGADGQPRVIVLGFSMTVDEAFAFAQLVFRRAGEAREGWTTVGNA